LHQELQPLRHLGRPLPPRLHLGEHVLGHPPFAERLP
jgi:hypothetical protein